MAEIKAVDFTKESEACGDEQISQSEQITMEPEEDEYPDLEEDADEGSTAGPEGEDSLTKYKLAPEIHDDYVVKIVNNHRNDLANAKIVVIIRRGKWYRKNMETWGSAKKVSPEMQVLTGPADFLLMINGEVWERISEAERFALVDHELMHCAREDDDKDGNPKYGLRNHDFEGFYSEIRRHGLWSPGLKKVYKAYEESKQGSMFDPLTAEITNQGRDQEE